MNILEILKKWFGENAGSVTDKGVAEVNKVLDTQLDAVADKVKDAVPDMFDGAVDSLANTIDEKVDAVLDMAGDKAKEALGVEDAAPTDAGTPKSE